MKRNIAYLIGCLFAGVVLTGCNSEEIREYSDLMLDTDQLVIDLDQTTEGTIHITNGNGNYKLALSDNNVATVAIDDNTIRVTALNPGKAEITVTDWAKKSCKAELVVKRLEELILTTNSLSVYVGETGTTSVYTGNKGYTISSSDETVLKGTIDEDGNITIEAVDKGTATFTITDAKGKTAALTVTAKRELKISQTGNLVLLFIEEPFVFDILDGNPPYEVWNGGGGSSHISVSLEGTKVTITGKSKARKTTNTEVWIKDAEKNEKWFKVLFIDEAYLNESSVFRYYINEDAIVQSATYFGSVFYVPEFNSCQMYIKTSTSSYASGYGIRFTGNLSVGAKSNASWFKISSGKLDEATVTPASDLRIDKVSGEWYWISFQTAGKSTRSYLVLKNTL
jgi:hypothetical protein